MQNNITTSNFKQHLPRAFLIAVASIIVIEAILYFIRPLLVTIFWNKFIINEHVLLDLPKEYDYLLLGDSIQKTGINPTLVSPELLALGLPGAKTQGLYLELKRYLRHHRAPKAVFLFIDPDDLKSAMYVILKYFVSVPEFMELWPDLTWEERLNFISRYWVSFDQRVVGLDVKAVYPFSNAQFVSELIANRGYMPSPGSAEPLEDGYFKRTGARVNKSIFISPRDVIYLDKIIKLCDKNKIKIVMLGQLLPKELHDILESTGFNRDYLVFMEAVHEKYPELIFAVPSILYLDNQYFGDPSHVNAEGADLYTRYFKERVFLPLKNELESERKNEGL